MISEDPSRTPGTLSLAAFVLSWLALFLVATNDRYHLVPIYFYEWAPFDTADVVLILALAGFLVGMFAGVIRRRWFLVASLNLLTLSLFLFARPGVL
jgi:hypothetical protein